MTQIWKYLRLTGECLLMFGTIPVLVWVFVVSHLVLTHSALTQIPLKMYWIGPFGATSFTWLAYLDMPIMRRRYVNEGMIFYLWLSYPLLVMASTMGSESTQTYYTAYYYATCIWSLLAMVFTLSFLIQWFIEDYKVYNRMQDIVDIARKSGKIVLFKPKDK